MVNSDKIAGGIALMVALAFYSGNHWICGSVALAYALLMVYDEKRR